MQTSTCRSIRKVPTLNDHSTRITGATTDELEYCRTVATYSCGFRFLLFATTARSPKYNSHCWIGCLGTSRSSKTRFGSEVSRWNCQRSHYYRGTNLVRFWCPSIAAATTGCCSQCDSFARGCPSGASHTAKRIKFVVMCKKAE